MQTEHRFRKSSTTVQLFLILRALGYANQKTSTTTKHLVRVVSKKKIKAFFTTSSLLLISFHTNPAATPIMAYKVLHTGAKIQLGGLKLGFIKVGYQVVMAERVTIPDVYPIARQAATAIIILRNLFMRLLF